MHKSLFGRCKQESHQQSSVSVQHMRKVCFCPLEVGKPEASLLFSLACSLQQKQLDAFLLKAEG